jgi:hypothetical protein
VSLSEVLSRSAEALWHVLAVGLVLGVGLPALFAVGIRCAHGQRVAAAAPARATAGSSSAGLVAAGLCFALCVLAVVGGIVVIIWGRTLFAG